VDYEYLKKKRLYKKCLSLNNYYEPVSVCFVSTFFEVVHGDALENKVETEELY